MSCFFHRLNREERSLWEPLQIVFSLLRSPAFLSLLQKQMLLPVHVRCEIFPNVQMCGEATLLDVYTDLQQFCSSLRSWVSSVTEIVYLFGL